MPLRQPLGYRNLFVFDSDSLDLLDSKDLVSEIQNLYLEAGELTFLALTSRHTNMVVSSQVQVNPSNVTLHKLRIEGEEPTGGHYGVYFKPGSTTLSRKGSGDIAFDEPPKAKIEAVRSGLVVDNTDLHTGPTGVFIGNTSVPLTGVSYNSLEPKWTVCRYDSGLTPMQRVDLGNTTYSIAKLGQYYYALCLDVQPYIVCDSPTNNAYGIYDSERPAGFPRNSSILNVYPSEEFTPNGQVYVNKANAAGTYSANVSSDSGVLGGLSDYTSGLSTLVTLRDIPVIYNNSYSVFNWAVASGGSILVSTDLTKSIMISPPVSGTLSLQGGILNQMIPRYNLVKLNAETLAIQAFGQWDSMVAYRNSFVTQMSPMSPMTNIVSISSGLIVKHPNFQPVAWNSVKASATNGSPVSDHIIIGRLNSAPTSTTPPPYSWPYTEPYSLYTNANVRLQLPTNIPPYTSQPVPYISLGSAAGVMAALATIPGIDDNIADMQFNDQIRFIGLLAGTQIPTIKWYFSDPGFLDTVLHYAPPLTGTTTMRAVLGTAANGGTFTVIQNGAPRSFSGTTAQTRLTDGFDILTNRDNPGTYRIRTSAFWPLNLSNWGQTRTLPEFPTAKTIFQIIETGNDGKIHHPIRVRYKGTWSRWATTSSDRSGSTAFLENTVASLMTELTGVQWFGLGRTQSGQSIMSYWVVNMSQKYDMNDFQIDTGYSYSEPLTLDTTSTQLSASLLSLGYLSVSMVTTWPLTQGPVRFNYVGPATKSNLALDVSGLSVPIATSVALNADMGTQGFTPASLRYPDMQFNERDTPNAGVNNPDYTSTNHQPQSLSKYLDSNRIWTNSHGEVYTDGLVQMDANGNVLNKTPVSGSIIFIDRFDDVYVAHTNLDPSSGLPVVDYVYVYDRTLVYKMLILNSSNTRFVAVDDKHFIYTTSIDSNGITIRKHTQGGSYIGSTAYIGTYPDRLLLPVGLLWTADKRLILATNRVVTQNWSVE